MQFTLRHGRTLHCCHPPQAKPTIQHSSSTTIPIFHRRIASRDAHVHLLSFGVYRPTLRPRVRNWIGCPSDFGTAARFTSIVRMGKTKKVFAMFSVSVPWPLDRSTTEHVEEVPALIDDAFVDIGNTIRTAWPDAYCATSEFWETEVR